MSSFLEVLRAMPLFRPIPPSELATLSVEHIERDAGEAFFAQGDPGDATWGVVTGRVKIAKQSPRGRDLILEVCGPGELFGAVAVMRGIPMPASAIALEPTACMRVAGASFRALIERHPAVAARLLETVSQRLLQANTARLALATDPVEVRLARALVRLADKFGARRQDEVLFTQAFTRQNLAELAGTTVESAIRTMSRWTKDGLLRSDASRLTILRMDELQRVAELDCDP